MSLCCTQIRTASPSKTNCSTGWRTQIGCGGRPGSRAIPKAGPSQKQGHPKSRAIPKSCRSSVSRRPGVVPRTHRIGSYTPGRVATQVYRHVVQRQSSFYGLNTRSQNSPITARHFERTLESTRSRCSQRSREISLKQTVGAHGGSSTSLGATCPGILRSRQT